MMGPEPEMWRRLHDAAAREADSRRDRRPNDVSAPPAVPALRACGEEWQAIADAGCRGIDVHMTIRPIHIANDLDRRDDGSAIEPVTGVDQQITDLPTTVVDDHVLDVTDVAVSPVEMAAAQAPYTLKGARNRRMRGRRSIRGVCGHTHARGSVCVCPRVRAVADLIARQSHLEPPSRPVWLTDADGRDEKRLRQPHPRADDEIMDGPVPVIDMTVSNAPDVAVERLQSEVFEVPESSQHQSFASVRPVLAAPYKSGATTKSPCGLAAPGVFLLAVSFSVGGNQEELRGVPGRPLVLD